MEFFTDAHEAKEIMDLQKDLCDIEIIFRRANSGLGFDRDKAEEIIRKNNTSDPFVYARNSNLATTIPLAEASIQTLADNLEFLHSYLGGKLTAKLKQQAEKEKNNADA